MKTILLFLLIAFTAGTIAGETKHGAVFNLDGDLRELDQVLAYRDQDAQGIDIIIVIFSNLALDKAAIAAAENRADEISRQVRDAWFRRIEKRDVLEIILREGEISQFSANIQLKNGNRNLFSEAGGDVLSLSRTRVSGRIPEQTPEGPLSEVVFSGSFDVEILE